MFRSEVQRHNKQKQQNYKYIIPVFPIFFQVYWRSGYMDHIV